MWHCPQGVHAFLRAYYHHKSADWTGNKPLPLAGWTAEELAKLPTYYVMDLATGHGGDGGAGDAVAPPRSPPAAGCRTSELAVYAGEYGRTGFQGGLQWYRVPHHRRVRRAELQLFSGRTIDVPSCFIAGNSDWGVYQTPRRARADAGERLHATCAAAIWSTAPATGCSRNSPSR